MITSAALPRRPLASRFPAGRRPSSQARLRVTTTNSSKLYIYRVSQNSVDFSLKWLLCTNKARWAKSKAIFGFSELFTYTGIS